MHKKDIKSYKNAFLIAIIYFIAGALWIVLSDVAVALIVEKAEDITTVQTYKGWFFIFTTTIGLFLLSYYFFHTMYINYAKNIEENNAFLKTKEELSQSKEAIKFSQTELSRHGKLLDTIINGLPEAIFAKNLDGNYILFNNGASDILNIFPDEILGRGDEILFAQKEAANIQEEEQKLLYHKKIITREEIHIVNKQERAFLTTRGVLLDNDDEVFGIFGIARDITEQKEYEKFLLDSKEKFYKLSHINHVTTLPNRLSLSEFLSEKCTKNLPFSLILFDLDEFKIVNDSYGHRFGDKLLLEIANTLKELFGSSVFIACIGGDEFAIVIDSNNIDVITILMRKLHATLNNPFKIEMTDVYITASSGVCSYPDDVKNVDELYQAADTAMYNAKKLGKNRFSFYDAKFKKEAITYTKMVTNLKHAIGKDELELYYQAQNSATSGKIIGTEALLRWKHDGKMIPPSIFIPLAEKSGLIIEVGNFVLKSGFEMAQKWHHQGVFDGRVSINVSIRQLAHLDFLKTLKELLFESGCKASWVELEITESYILENPKLAIALLEELKELGFNISMDDFGTGYSSLSYLKNLPIDKLKIDRSFVTNIQNEPKNQIIVKTIIFLAKELGIHILAEGVETQEEQEFLLQNGIDSIQGFYYHKPVCAKEMESLMLG